MEDIVERIRRLRFVHIPWTSDLMEEACQEIERLRQSDRPGPVGVECQDFSQKNLTLTDEEREAIEGAADLLIGSKPGATLRNLLGRLGGND